MSLSDIVNINISRSTAAVSQKGFGVPLVVGEGALFAERVRTYTSMDGVAEDLADG